MTDPIARAQKHLDAVPPADGLTLAADVRALIVEVQQWIKIAAGNMERGTRNAHEVARLLAEVERLTAENQRLRIHGDDSMTVAEAFGHADAFASNGVKRVSPEVDNAKA